MRFLFGNDDEFSTMEYSHRTKRLQYQCDMPTDSVTTSRIKDQSSRWGHPQDTSIDKSPQFYAHDWTLLNLLKGFEAEDHKIRNEFECLGMSELLSDEPLFRVW